jgi:chromosome segregation ATPase
MKLQTNLQCESGFDPTVPEKGVVVRERDDMDDLFYPHFPSDTEIAITAREAFRNVASEELIHDIVRCSSEINESARRIMHEHMSLGFKFGEIMRRVHAVYIEKFGNNQKTSRQATAAVYAYIEKLHRISNSKVRMHLRAYAKFHSNAEAVEFLSQTDMQELLPKDIDDEIVNAIIEKRKASAQLSTREVRALIAAYRQVREELSATREQVETVNNETVTLTTRYDVSKEAEQRLRREVEQMRLQQFEERNAMHRLGNELSVLSGTRNALYQQLSETERERDVALRELSEMSKRAQKWKHTETSVSQTRFNEDVSNHADVNELDEKIQTQEAEVGVSAAKQGEAKAALNTCIGDGDEMNALVADFCAFAQRYHRVQLLTTAEGNPERYKPVFDLLVDVVGKFYMEIAPRGTPISATCPGDAPTFGSVASHANLKGQEVCRKHDER